MSPQAQRWTAASTTLGVCVGLLAVLKIVGVTDISWWWVFAPWWLPLIAVVGYLIVQFFVTIIFGVLSSILTVIGEATGIM